MSKPIAIKALINNPKEYFDLLPDGTKTNRRWELRAHTTFVSSGQMTADEFKKEVLNYLMPR